jgi:hypothetical protein
LRVERASGSGGGGADDPIELTIVDEPPVDGVGGLAEPPPAEVRECVEAEAA